LNFEDEIYIRRGVKTKKEEEEVEPK